MISLSSAEYALKSVYLGAVNELMNNKINPFLAVIDKTSEGVYGKDIKTLARLGMRGGIGAGTEEGVLPKAAPSTYLQFTNTLKNLYGQIAITDKAIRASASGEGAFVDLLTAEMEALLAASKVNMGRMLFSDGSGILCRSHTLGASASLYFDCASQDIYKFTIGQVIDIYNNSTYVSTTRIKKIDYDNWRVYYESAQNTSNFFPIIYAAGSKDSEISGLEYYFNPDNTAIHGVSIAENPGILPIATDFQYELTDTQLQNLIDSLECRTGCEANYIATSPAIRTAYVEYLSGFKRNIDFMNLQGGFKALSFNGIPIVADRFCGNYMYVLNTDDFKLHQLCDWSWLENERGAILHKDADKATYSATLVKYAELICSRPNAIVRAENCF